MSYEKTGITKLNVSESRLTSTNIHFYRMGTCRRVASVLFRFFSDDWALFIREKKGVDPYVLVNRPVYALALFWLHSAFSDSMFLWQLASALLLFAAAWSVYLLTAALLRQFLYKQNEYRLGATFAAVIYLLAPWSVVMSAWPTVAITLLSQIFVAGGLTCLVMNHAKYSTVALIFLLAGFLTYEAYWLLVAPITVICWMTNSWTLRDCLRLIGLALGAIIITILIKLGLSKIWGISGKAISTNFLPMLLHNIKSYPRVLGDALQPASFKYFYEAVLIIALFAWVLEGRYKRVAGLFASLFIGLGSSALLYAVVNYDLAGTGVMSRTLAAQNIYFSLFIGIIMAPGIAKWRILYDTGFRNFFRSPSKQTIALLFQYSALLILVIMLSIATIKRSLEWLVLWTVEISVLKQFPHEKLLEDLNRSEKKQKTTVIVQVDNDRQGDIFGAAWEIGPALIWMYPELKPYVESGKLTFAVGREPQWLTVWDGTKIIQKWCHDKSAVVYTTEATNQVLYAKLNTDGNFQYYKYTPNVETGCHVTQLVQH